MNCAGRRMIEAGGECWASVEEATAKTCPYPPRRAGMISTAASTMM